MSDPGEDVSRMDEARCGSNGAARKRPVPSLADPEAEKQWLANNREAIAEYNCRVAEHGLLSDLVGLL